MFKLKMLHANFCNYFFAQQQLTTVHNIYVQFLRLPLSSQATMTMRLTHPRVHTEIMPKSFVFITGMMQSWRLVSSMSSQMLGSCANEFAKLSHGPIMTQLVIIPWQEQ